MCHHVVACAVAQAQVLETIHPQQQHMPSRIRMVLAPPAGVRHDRLARRAVRHLPANPGMVRP